MGGEKKAQSEGWKGFRDNYKARSADREGVAGQPIARLVEKKK